jgi:hypothetical protein
VGSIKVEAGSSVNAYGSKFALIASKAVVGATKFYESNPAMIRNAKEKVETKNGEPKP